MRHFHDLYAMKHCHMANGHPRRKIPKFPDGGANVPRRGGGYKAPPVPPPVAPRLFDGLYALVVCFVSQVFFEKKLEVS